jgi:hypothetical protein
MKYAFILCIAVCFTVGAAAAEWWDDAKGAALEAAKKQIDEVKGRALGKAEGKFLTTEETAGSFAVTNWTDQYVEATAIATADPAKAKTYAHALSLAETAARAICQRKMLEQIGGVRVSSRILLKDEMVRDDTLMTMAEGLLVGAKEVSVTHEELGDGSVLCTMTMGLLLTTGTGVMKLGEYERVKNPTTFDAYAPVAPTAPDKKYTGVIIDASALDVVPALLPNIFAEDGKVVYGAQTLDNELLLNEGTSTYARSIREAMASRAGEEPFIVKALKAVGETACDLIIPDNIADLLFGLEKETGVMSKGRVVILTR